MQKTAEIDEERGGLGMNSSIVIARNEIVLIVLLGLSQRLDPQSFLHDSLKNILAQFTYSRMIFTKTPSGSVALPRMWTTPSLVKPRSMVSALGYGSGGVSDLVA
jgi:hypothetical protein